MENQINNKDNVMQLPPEILLEEKRSRKDRILLEVMQKLSNLLPVDKPDNPIFSLESGHKCWVRRFGQPKEREDGLSYGFDIIVEDGLGVDHLEFFVHCTGFGGFI